MFDYGEMRQSDFVNRYGLASIKALINRYGKHRNTPECIIGE